MPEQKTGTTATRRTRTSTVGLIATILTAALLITAPTGVLAKGKPTRSGGPGTVLVSPNPVSLGQVFTVSGSGYATSTQINVKDISATSISVRILGTTSTGTFSLSSQTWTAGSHRIEVWQYSGGKWALAGSGSYSAY